MMGSFILPKTWNISILFIPCAFLGEFFCTVVEGHCFQCCCQIEKVTVYQNFVILTIISSKHGFYSYCKRMFN